jgi:hypothetical protein
MCSATSSGSHASAKSGEDPDATSGLPGARERFRQAIRGDFALKAGWPVEHTVITEPGSIAHVKAKKECIIC